MYVWLTIIMSCFGILPVLVFWLNVSLNLHMTYEGTFEWLRVFGRAFAAGCCTNLVAYYCDIGSLFWTATLFVSIFGLHAVISAWVLDGRDKSLLVDGDYNERFFQRGDAKTQLDFVARKLKIFAFIFTVSALCTLGQLRTSSSVAFDPETISNVFCKIDSKNQLECVVDVTYYDPAAPDADTCHCDLDSQEWDFCGLAFALHALSCKLMVSYFLTGLCTLSLQDPGKYIPPMTNSK